MTAEEKEQIVIMRRNGHSYGQISKHLDISANTIKSFCRRSGMAGTKVLNNVGTKGENSVNGNHDKCKNCGKKLKQNKRGKPKKFCSETCRRIWWKENEDQHNKKAFYLVKCQECGVQFESYGNEKRKYCSHACYIKNRFGKGTEL